MSRSAGALSRLVAGAAVAVLVLVAGCEDTGDGAPGPLSAEPDALVAEWNETAMSLGPSVGTHRAIRALAMMHTATYDAVMAFGGGYRPYHVTAAPPAGASPRAAAAAAAFHVLGAVYTEAEQQAAIQARYDGQLADIADGPAEAAGVEFGRQVAEAILALREHDGAMAAMGAECPDGTEPGAWRRTESGEPMAPGWGEVTPWTMHEPDEYDQGGPPALDSQEYADAYEEVRLLGGRVSTTRTADDEFLATFWEPHVPAKWAGLAREMSAREELSLADSSRLFALVAVALADSAVAVWRMKYRYTFWRPETAIRLGDDDGNDQTVGDPAWAPLLVSPAFPEYVSGHSLTCAAMAAVLDSFLGTDHYDFELMSHDGLESRAFESFREAAEEAGRSRVSGGIHFSFSNEDGLAAGEELGEHAFEHFFRPL